MSKKHYFFLYFALLGMLYHSIPVLLPSISQYKFGLLLYTYQQPTILIGLFCTTNMFFTYLSILIPKEELASLDNFMKLRRPASFNLFWHSRMLLLPYFGCYLLTKFFSFILLPHPLNAGLVCYSMMIWVIFFFLSVKIKVAVSNYFLCLGIICSHLILTVLFI